MSEELVLSGIANMETGGVLPGPNTLPHFSKAGTSLGPPGASIMLPTPKV
jgi:hypothetical protein